MSQGAFDAPGGPSTPSTSADVARAALWVPSLYFVQGLPYALVNNALLVMFKNLAVSNTDAVFWSSWLSLVWAFKALWSPFVDTFSTKRRWILAMQGAMGPVLALLAFVLPVPFWFQATIAIAFVLAFLSATHDIAADGLYILGLDKTSQAGWIGVRSTFWRLALWVGGDGAIVMLTGWLLERGYAPAQAWQVALLAAAGVFVVLTLFHLIALPIPVADRPSASVSAASLGEMVRSFVAKPNFGAALAFLFFYRFAENQLMKIIIPFLLDPRVEGGLALTNLELSYAKGTVGLAMLMLGGVLGGLALARWGLKACLWPMVFILHVPDVVFVYLAWVQPTSLTLITALIGLEQFGYGFGFTAYMMFLMKLAEGPYKTAHYAFGTGIMALSVSLTGMGAGWLQERIGYPMFFLWVLASIIPGVIVAAAVRIDPPAPARPA